VFSFLVFLCNSCGLRILDFFALAHDACRIASLLQFFDVKVKRKRASLLWIIGGNSYGVLVPANYYYSVNVHGVPSVWRLIPLVQI
jgi:hypothetical protein